MNRRMLSVQVMELLSAYTQNGIIPATKAKEAVCEYAKGEYSALKNILSLEIPVFLIPLREELRTYVE